MFKRFIVCVIFAVAIATCSESYSEAGEDIIESLPPAAPRECINNEGMCPVLSKLDPIEPIRIASRVANEYDAHPVEGCSRDVISSSDQILVYFAQVEFKGIDGKIPASVRLGCTGFKSGSKGLLEISDMRAMAESRGLGKIVRKAYEILTSRLSKEFEPRKAPVIVASSVYVDANSWSVLFRDVTGPSCGEIRAIEIKR